MIRLADVSCDRGGRPVLRDVSLEVAAGELLVLLGPSGSGKTSLLRLVAGLERPAAGAISLGADLVSAPGVHVPPERRRVGMVFQDLALWPHMSARAHLDFVLRGTALARAERRRRAADLLGEVGLAALADRLPGQLSGGEQQRLAVARALAGEPRTLLLDEPFTSLEGPLRTALGSWVCELHRRHRTATIFVTHLVEEGLALADRVAVLHAGRLDQVGTPDALCACPRTTFVARLVGYPNLLPVSEVAGDATACTPLGEIRIGVTAASPDPAHLRLALRAEDLEARPAANGSATCRVLERVWSADRLLYRGDAAGLPVVFRAVAALAVGDRVTLAVTGPGLLVEDRP